MTKNASERNEKKPIANRAVIIISGGMDSTTLLYRLIREKREIFALSFNYGQKHKKELDCAKKVCQRFGIPHKIIDLTTLQQSQIFGESSLTSEKVKVPEGNYTDLSMQSTVVPNRNMILLSMAIAFAISIDASTVYYGAHAGDHAIYPDCRPEFVQKMQAVAEICHYFPIRIEAPYLMVTKSDILREGISLNVDYEMTWTCYKGTELACGKCGSCVERLEAFANNHIIDPLKYENQIKK